MKVLIKPIKRQFIMRPRSPNTNQIILLLIRHVLQILGKSKVKYFPFFRVFKSQTKRQNIDTFMDLPSWFSVYCKMQAMKGGS